MKLSKLLKETKILKEDKSREELAAELDKAFKAGPAATRAFLDSKDGMSDIVRKDILLNPQTDGNAGDDAVAIGTAGGPAMDYKPTQSEIDLMKSVSYPLGSAKTLTEAITSGPTAKGIVTSGDLIIDGHHRWSGAIAIGGKNAKIAGTDVNWPGTGTNEKLAAAQIAIAAKIGPGKKIPSQAEGFDTNIMGKPADEIAKMIMSNVNKKTDPGAPGAMLNDKMIKDLVGNEASGAKVVYDWLGIKPYPSETKNKGYKLRLAIAKKVGENLAALPDNPEAPERKDMPQFDPKVQGPKLDTVTGQLGGKSQGDYNLAPPYVKDSVQSNKPKIQEMKKKKIQEAIETLKMKRIAKIISEAEFQKQLRLLEDAKEDLANAMKKDLAGAVADLKSLASKEDFKSIATKGTEDGDPGDEKVPVGSDNIANTKMYPTQAEIGFGNSLDDIVNDKYGAIDSAFSEPVKMPSPEGKVPVLCASIGGKIAILDGHHRWSLCFMINPGAKMACDIMEAPTGMDPENALKTMQLAIAAKAGKLVTKPFEGKDLMATSTEEVRKYILDNIGEKEVATFAKYRKDLNTKEAIADHVAEAHKKIVAMAGPFPRIIMPQAGKSGTSQDTVNNALKAGEINFKEPFTAKESKQNSKFEAQLFEAVMKRSIAELGRAVKRKK